MLTVMRDRKSDEYNNVISNGVRIMNYINPRCTHGIVDKMDKKERKRRKKFLTMGEEV